MVVGMYSDEREHFRFHTPQKAEGAVEDWMRNIDEQMQDGIVSYSSRGIGCLTASSSNDLPGSLHSGKSEAS